MKLRNEFVEIPVSFTISAFVLAGGLTLFVGSNLTGLSFRDCYDVKPVISAALIIDLLSRFSQSNLIAKIAPSLMYGSVLVVLISFLGFAVSHITQCAHFKLQDDLFESMDSALGVDWIGFIHFIDERPWLAKFLRFCYHTIALQSAIPVIVLAAQGRTQELRIFIGAMAISLAVVIIVATVLPAFSHIVTLDVTSFHHVQFSGATPVDQLMALRSEHPRLVNGSGGLLSFPSYHAVMGILCPLALRRSKLFLLSVLVSAGLLAGSVTEGTHYVCDVIAGVILAFVSYWLSSALHTFEYRCRAFFRVTAAINCTPPVTLGRPQVS